MYLLLQASLLPYYCISHYYLITADYFKVQYYLLLHIPLLLYYYGITTDYYMIITTYYFKVYYCVLLHHYYSLLRDYYCHYFLLLHRPKMGPLLPKQRFWGLKWTRSNGHYYSLLPLLPITTDYEPGNLQMFLTMEVPGLTVEEAIEV